MNKILPHFRPWLGAILLSLVLLFIQANMDLALPDYLSRIVNIGIQQGGIEDPLPTELSAQTAELVMSLSESLFPDSYGEQSSSQILDGLYVPRDGGSVFVLEDDASSLLESNAQLRRQFYLSFVAAEQMLDNPIENQDAAQLERFLEIEDNSLEQLAIQAHLAELQRLGVDATALQSAFIWKTGAIMILLALVSAGATISVSYIGARVAAGVGRDLRGKLFRQVQQFSSAEIDRFSTASLITRSTNDITQIQTTSFLLIRLAFLAPIMGIGGVVRALGKAPSMAWLIALAVLILLGLIASVMSVAIPRFKKIQKLTDSLNRVAREQLSGLMVIRAFNRQDFESERFERANADLTKTNLSVMRLMVVMMPAIMLLMQLLTVAVLWVGAGNVASSTMMIGDLIAFLQYALQIVWSFVMLSMVFFMLPRASVSAARIAEVLETESSISSPAEPAVLPSGEGRAKGVLEFRDVSFCYPGAGESAVEHISFTAEPGKTTAIIGSTGSGKSSLVNLIPRLYDVCQGEILLDGVDIRSIELSKLREQVGFVPQKSSLFTGTIEENISFGREPMSSDDVTWAAQVAQAQEFISQRDEGFSAPISQGGGNLSGGQRQRMTIARAIASKAPVLVFDDSFSALDYKTDAALRRTLAEQLSDSTRIIVAQRVATIMNAEQIIVLDQGKMVGIGLHDELVKNCPQYGEIVRSQFGTQEAS